MSTTRAKRLITTTVRVAVAAAAAPAVLFVGAGISHALPVDYLPAAPICADCVGFNPQPDPPGYPSDHLPINNKPEYGGPDSVPSPRR
ncbi:hypothetical protein JDV09_19730 [Mycobacterium sp. Y57]|uniref:hypothetical protein n=1 Tax=Mycolicibacterium xanthum TaxID=2796469 RepID=UPI001C85001A|nr:hypothetical protein [Mycolicibacterium xanthum]MBX7434310.1 hypothetical protein [Mycolicibacterium xanthum]